MTSEAYITAWLLYLCGATGLLVVVWYLTRSLKSAALREPLRLIAAVCLLFPFPIDDGYSEWAPAFLMLAFEGVFEGGQAALRTGIPLLSTTIAVLIMAGMAEWWLRKRQQQASAEREATAEFDALVEDSQQQAAQAKPS
ncbi:hypothetical protein R50073_14480 [Maricurvus nonylphenolicus]|uniref:hypothetical protein n=1 Tax=Maricurvus nonylphenolicus TaxID=1008307 RepID=UPI0036F20808